MEHRNSFLTGFLAGQRLKRWQRGLASGEGGGTDFYQWAAQSGAPAELTDPAAYAQFAAAINPALRLNSDSSLTWTPTVDDMPSGAVVVFRNKTGWSATGGTSYMYGVGVNAAMGWSFSSARFSVSLDSGRRSWTVLFRESTDKSGELGLDGYRLLCPLDGTYDPAGAPSIQGTGNMADGSSVALDHNYGVYHRIGNSVSGTITASRVMYAGRAYDFGVSGTGTPGSANNQYSVQYGVRDSNTRESVASAAFRNFLPAFRVIPHSTASWNLSVRPGFFPGSPVNEQARTFTNPITGEIIPFDSFSYDFQTRTYALTLPDSGGTITVTFGDDGISFTLPDGEDRAAMYPDDAGTPIVSPDGTFHKDAFLSGLAAGMASHGF